MDVSEWREALAMMLSNRTTTSATAICHLGDSLAMHGQRDLAHFWYGHLFVYVLFVGFCMVSIWRSAFILNEHCFWLSNRFSFLVAGEQPTPLHPNSRVVLIGADHNAGMRKFATSMAIQVCN